MSASFSTVGRPLSVVVLSGSHGGGAGVGFVPCPVGVGARACDARWGWGGCLRRGFRQVGPGVLRRGFRLVGLGRVLRRGFRPVGLGSALCVPSVGVAV